MLKGNQPARPYLRAVVDDVRTLLDAGNAGFRAVLANIKLLRTRTENIDGEEKKAA